MEIYALRDPRTGALRYIGKANCARRRFVTHQRDAHRRNTPVYAWWRDLLAEGCSPVLEILDNTVTEATWAAQERELIATYRLVYDLLNVAPGGNAPHCPHEVRARNALTAVAERCSTPFKKRVYELKRALMSAHRRGELSEGVKVKLRHSAQKRPDLFSCFASV